MSASKQAAAGSACNLLDEWLGGIRKSAAQKKAEDPTPPTTNPVMSAPDGTQKYTEGERGRENDADVTAELGALANVGESAVNSNEAGAKPTDTMGTQKQDSDAVKGNVPSPKESPKATHESVFKSAQLAKQAGDLLSLFGTPAVKAATGGAPVKVEAPSVPAKAAAGDSEVSPEKKMLAEMEEKKAFAQKHPEAAELGFSAADWLLQELGLAKSATVDPEKEALTVKVASVIEAAHNSAERVASYLKAHADGAKIAALSHTKKAEPEIAAMTGAVSPEGPGAGAMPGADAGAGMPPEMGGGGMPPEAGGGMPPEMGGGAGAPPPGAGGPGGGGDINGQLVEAIAQALDSGEVTPEELVAALEQTTGANGGGGGGEMPGAGGPPPGAGGPPQGGGGGGEMPEKSKPKSEGGEEKQEEKKEDTAEDSSKEAQHKMNLKKASAIVAAVKQRKTSNTKAASLAQLVAAKIR